MHHPAAGLLLWQILEFPATSVALILTAVGELLLITVTVTSTGSMVPGVKGLEYRMVVDALRMRDYSSRHPRGSDI